jgi:hypothetical protein
MLYELLGKDAIADPVRLAAGIKALPVRVTAHVRPSTKPSARRAV